MIDVEMLIQVVATVRLVVGMKKGVNEVQEKKALLVDAAIWMVRVAIKTFGQVMVVVLVAMLHKRFDVVTEKEKVGLGSKSPWKMMKKVEK